MAPGGGKYLSTSEMVSGYHKSTKTPIPNLVIPGDYRVYRPTKYDVLCGRGKPIQDHSGNLRLRRIVSKFTERYMNARRHKKQEIVEEVVELVKNSGGVLARFLKRVGRENYWVEVPKAVACDKVSHALRCLVRKTEAGETLDFSEGDDESCDEVQQTASVAEAAAEEPAAAVPPAAEARESVSQPAEAPPAVAAAPQVPYQLSWQALLSQLSTKNNHSLFELQTRLALSQLNRPQILELVVATRQIALQKQQEEASKIALANDLLRQVVEAEQRQQNQQLEQQALAGRLKLALLALANGSRV
eukprot:Nitzschia sp. Nitz4//scaffold267_size26297//19168//20076//NITZ4_008271-RA/size26297-processed-gene-0.8-mRNA-1//-1//CDS//3329544911//1916//frame0